MNYDALINFKWGSEPQGKVERNGLSRKWLFCKPDSGNLSPSAQVPFSTFSSIPYSGGYPTGYGNNEYCCWATPKKTKYRKLMGFTHFNYSGCGDLKLFHNYFMIEPYWDPQEIIEEKYTLNGYEIKTDAYTISCTADRRTMHYTIESKEPITILPGFSGLTTEHFHNNIEPVNISVQGKYVKIDADYEKLHLYWAMEILKGDIEKVNEETLMMDESSEFILSYSLDSLDDALLQLQNHQDDGAVKEWNRLLNQIQVKGERSDLFYTALHAALKKPFIYNENEVYDFATMWDIYKTQLPLIFSFYKKEAAIIVAQMLKLVNEDGRFYHTCLLSKQGPMISVQAFCIMNITLSMAKMYQVEFDEELAKKLQKKEIEYYLSHTELLTRTTYILDVCDAITAYYNAYEIDLGLEWVKNEMIRIFDKNGVYLDKKSEYYEGNYANYSFRVSSSTDYRIKNKEELLKGLDSFFGFTGKDSVRFFKPTAQWIVEAYVKTIQRFEGLNNEPDMESMYLYSYLNEYEHQNEVIDAVFRNSFSMKDNGLPGNDDNGGLSSWIVWNMMGLYPIVGTNKIKIGCPQLDEVAIGKFHLIAHKENRESVYIDRVMLNGKEANNFEIGVDELFKENTLEIYLR